MDARDYNLCLSADHNDAVVARNHGYGYFDNRIVTDEFLWVCEQLGYVKERTCEVEGIEYDDLLDMWSVELSCGHIVHPIYRDDIPKFCEECGARVDGYGAEVVGHETRNMSDKENTCEGCAYEGLPGYCGCDGCARGATDNYRPKVVE